MHGNRVRLAIATTAVIAVSLPATIATAVPPADGRQAPKTITGPVLVTRVTMKHAKPSATVGIAVDLASHRIQLNSYNDLKNLTLRVVVGRVNHSGACVPGVQIFTRPSRFTELTAYDHAGNELSANTNFPGMRYVARVELADGFRADCTQTALITGTSPAHPGRVVNASGVFTPHHPTCQLPLTDHTNGYGTGAIRTLTVGGETTMKLQFPPSYYDAYAGHACSPMFLANPTIHSDGVKILDQPTLHNVDTWRRVRVTLGVSAMNPYPVPQNTRIYLRAGRRDSVWVSNDYAWKVQSAPPDWHDSLAGHVVWTSSEDIYGTVTRPTLDFVDRKWVRVTTNWPPKTTDACTSVSKTPGGCHRYYYNRRSNGLQIDHYRAATTRAGIWQLQVGVTTGVDYMTRFNPTHVLRHSTRGARLTYHGRGQDRSKCGSSAGPAPARGGCNYPIADLVFRHDGTYRISERKRVQHGHYRLLAGNRVRLDRGRRGGPTRVRAIYQWTGPLNGHNRVLALDLGPYATDRVR